jgi:cysteine desulfurase / selenocysteine lyase
MTPQTIARLRAETKGVGNVIHFNNAGASLTPDAVYNSVIRHLEREREIGGYEAKDEASVALNSFYTETARLIGAKPDEIAFIENATRAWDMAFYSLPFFEGDEIITAESEYASNYLAYLQIVKKRGVIIKVAPNEPNGQVDVSALEKLITSRTKLIAITHVPSQGGLVNPASEIGKVAKAHGVLYLLDACQSVGQMPIDVNVIGCDMLSATGRKFLRGPRGTGFLYMRKELANSLEPILIDLHAAAWTGKDSYELAVGAKRFENWECFYAGKIGLAQSVSYALNIGLNQIEKRNAELASHLRDGLSDVNGVKLTDLGLKKCAIVTFAKGKTDPEKIKSVLKNQNMNVSVSPASYARLDLPMRGYQALVRASIHYYNTVEEIEKFVAAIKSIK